MAKIVKISNYSSSLINFRGDLIRAMIELGHEVVCLGPEAGFERPLQELGADYRQISLHRTGLNPLRDIKTLFLFCKLRLSLAAMLSFSVIAVDPPICRTRS